jgi:hypothetical protein
MEQAGILRRLNSGCREAIFATFSRYNLPSMCKLSQTVHLEPATLRVDPVSICGDLTWQRSPPGLTTGDDIRAIASAQDYRTVGEVQDGWRENHQDRHPEAGI